MVNFYKRLAEIRKSKKLNQEKFAELMGTNKVQVSRYENGERTPDAEYITKIAEIFKIDTNWLITGNGNMFLEEQKQPQEDCICKEKEKMLAAFDKLPRERQEYYHYKIIAEALD